MRSIIPRFVASLEYSTSMRAIRGFDFFALDRPVNSHHEADNVPGVPLLSIRTASSNLQHSGNVCSQTLRC